MKYLLLILITFSVNSVAGETLPELIERTKKSIVAVGTYESKRSPRGVFLGTGFAIGRNNIIVTNAHVVPAKLDSLNNETLAIFFRYQNDIKIHKAKLVAIDKQHDIALLQITSGDFPALSIGKNQVREGQSIIFTGYPIGTALGLYPVTHRGIISAITPIVIPMQNSRQLNAKLLKRLRNPFLVYQLDATAYPGNSGSPVLDAQTGNVIGIVNKVFVKESKETVLSKPSGITYAIPVKYLNELLQKNNENRRKE